MPYIPGFLAYREVDPIVDLIQNQIKLNPEITPNFIMVDGNGMLHARKFGLACHVGVLTDISTIGISKNYYDFHETYSPEPNVSDVQKQAKIDHKEALKENLKCAGDILKIHHPKDNTVVGYALKGSDKAERCIYVSVGHKISLLKAKNIALRTCEFKIPEATRQADILSRDYIRNLLQSVYVPGR